jgi:hypothetical protein
VIALTVHKCRSVHLLRKQQIFAVHRCYQSESYEDLDIKAMNSMVALLRLTRTRADSNGQLCPLRLPPLLHHYNLFHTNRPKRLRSVRLAQLDYGSDKKYRTSPLSRAETNILDPVPPSPRPEVAKMVGYLRRCASRPSCKRDGLQEGSTRKASRNPPVGSFDHPWIIPHVWY